MHNLDTYIQKAVISQSVNISFLRLSMVILARFAHR